MAKHHHHKTAGPLDVIKYGSEAAGVKASVSPNMWRKIVALANKRGFTVAGAVSGNPTPLKERTNGYLLKQAQKLVGQSYDPTLKQLDSQQSQLTALADKRKADNESYQQWLLGKQAQYNTQAAAAHQQYQSYLDGLKSQTQASHEQAQTDATAAVQGQPGTVSDLSQSTALKGLSADTTRATGLVDNARQQTAAMLPSFEMRQDARQQAVVGQGQAAEAKRTSDLNTGLQQLSDQRFKVLAAKAQDTFKTYFDSLNQQVDIANSNRNFGAAADKLGLDQQKLQLDQTKASRDYKLKSKTLNEKTANDAAKLKIGYAKIKANAGQKAADRALKRELAKEKNTAKSRPVLTPQQQSKLYQDATTAQGMYQDLVAKHPGGVLNNGDSIRHYLRGKGVSDSLYELAVDLATYGGKVSAHGRKVALSLGIPHPYNLFGKANVGTNYNGPN